MCDVRNHAGAVSGLPLEHVGITVVGEGLAAALRCTLVYSINASGLQGRSSELDGVP